VREREGGDDLEQLPKAAHGLGECPYDPVIDPANFVSKVTNRYYPSLRQRRGDNQRYPSGRRA
jgi:hypothetical protein